MPLRCIYSFRASAIRIPDFFSLYGVAELPWFWKPFYSFPFTLLAIVLIPALIAGALGYLGLSQSHSRRLLLYSHSGGAGRLF